MAIIECHTFLGGIDQSDTHLRCDPKAVTTDEVVYVWRGKQWEILSRNENIDHWIRQSPAGRLIIRGKLRIKV